MTGPATDPEPLPTLRALFADADDAVFVTVVGTSIAFANSAATRITGQATAALVGRDCLSLLDDITDPAAVERVREALASDTHLRADVWMRRAEEAPSPSRWELLPLRDAQGGVTHRVIVAHDLTAQRLAEQSLADLRGSARRAGHDLNNMITGLVLNLSLLNGSAFSETQRQACITDAIESARDGSRVTRQLLDATGPDRSGSPFPDAPALGMQRPSSSSWLTDDGGGRRGSLLLLDDNERLLRMMAGFLEQAGFLVRATSDPTECVAIYREAHDARQRFDLVILDLTIDRGREGLGTLAALQAIDPGVRAIAHSGHSSADVMTAPRAHGFVAAIQKPTPLSELAAMIDALLRGASSQWT
jgi:PAS domain S-box-containing protein